MGVISTPPRPTLLYASRFLVRSVGFTALPCHHQRVHGRDSAVTAGHAGGWAASGCVRTAGCAGDAACACRADACASTAASATSAVAMRDTFARSRLGPVTGAGSPQLGHVLIGRAGTGVPPGVVVGAVAAFTASIESARAAMSMRVRETR